MIEINKKDICDRIVKLRAERGWTQAKLSEESGVNIRTIAQYETYREAPMLLNAARLARGFGVTIDYLVFGGGVDVE